MNLTLTREIKRILNYHGVIRGATSATDDIIKLLKQNLNDMALIQITDEKHLQYFCNGENCDADDCECEECYEPEKRGGVLHTKADLIKQICEQEYDAEVDETIAGTDVYFTLEKVEIE
jgi:hypothetical protein